MARVITPGLQDLLDLPSCETQTTLKLVLADTTEYYLATAALTVGLQDYTDDLRKGSELVQSAGLPPDRCSVAIQNIDKVFGSYAAAEDLIKAIAVVGRHYSDPSGILPSVHVELFAGEAMPLGISETDIQIEILSDMVAAGYCVGDWTLAENCQFRFKHAETCGYSGIETVCNKKRKSKLGCLGRYNEHHFGGMEYPDIQTPVVPDGSGSGLPPGHQTCPRLDQYVLVRGKWSHPDPCKVGDLTLLHRLFNPKTGTYHRIRSLTVIKGQPIWEVWAENNAVSFSSRSHRLIWYAEHEDGEPACKTVKGDPILTWTGKSEQSTLIRSRDTGEIGDVLRIEMGDGYIYCVADDPDDGFIVCHNSKPPMGE